MAKIKSKKSRFVISCILSFLLAVLFTCATVMIVVKIGFLSKNSVLNGLNKKGYYQSAEADFYKDAKDYTIPVGLPVEVVEGIIDSEKVYEDVKGYVTASVNNKGYAFDTDDLQSRLTENVYQYFQDEGLEMNEEQIETVPVYTKMIANIYIKNMKVEFVTLIGKINAAFGGWLWFGAIACFGLSAGIIVMLIKLQRWKHRGVRFVAYSSITTVILLLTPVVVGTILSKTLKPNIEPEHLYYALTNYCAGGMRMLLYMAIGWMAVTAALLILIHYLKKKSSRRVR